MLFSKSSGTPSQICLSHNRLKCSSNRQRNEENQNHPNDRDLDLWGNVLLALFVIKAVIKEGKSTIKDAQILSVGQQADFHEDPLGQKRIFRGEEVLWGYFTPLSAVMVDVNRVWVAIGHHLRICCAGAGCQEGHGR
ncbi:hypothetical protein CKAH01_07601 [Colletotrichum kahawae]|uniref:Uncharacterized protein n=1 Tax=Colletotrichum kahawae TaxID=34407 RepID=A0AAD9Y5U6_COLKA|nr:hypothetical protein CKAH01_07601 [Colletotrichum kahawae]